MISAKKINRTEYRGFEVLWGRSFKQSAEQGRPIEKVGFEQRLEWSRGARPVGKGGKRGLAEGTTSPEP